MRLARLELEQFRVYRHLTLDVPAAGLRLYGRNASGKTSLLEAIYLLSTTRSPRATSDRDLINWTSNEEYGLAPYARVIAQVADQQGRHELEIALVSDGMRPGTTRKRIKVDGVPRRATDLVGRLKSVLFSPEDLNLILGSPALRRRFLDITIAQLDRLYLQALSRYQRVVEQRNSLLKDLGGREGKSQGRTIDDELSYWDGEIVRYGAYLLAARVHYVAGLERESAAAFAALAGETPRLGLRYESSLDLVAQQRDRLVSTSLTEAQGLLARALDQGLRQRRSDELRRGATVIGPHRDDLRFLSDGRDLAAFGSRGQQRLAVVATKLAELGQVLALSGEQPVLLLDDVLSELDAPHQERLLAAIGATGCQVILTGTERRLLEHPSLASLPLAEAESGELRFDGGETSEAAIPDNS